VTRFLDPLDSAFVLLEVSGSAMNIGAVIELDFGETSDPTERFNRIRQNISDRLHEIPVLTQRIVRAPLDITWPILVPEKKFDIDRHVLRVALPAPGTPDQFDAVISEFLSRPLLAHRPLWQLLVLEGLEDGRAAVALKVHHALADGVSGAETFASLFDISPEVRPPAPKVESDEETPSVTTSLGLLREGFGKIQHRPQLIVESVQSWAVRLFEIVRALVKIAVVRGRKQATPGQPSIFEAKRTSLNGAPGVEKEFHRLRLPLADVSERPRPAARRSPTS
jgi:diacylglycerol O-acyltransferase